MRLFDKIKVNMKNVNITHHPFRGNFTVFLRESTKITSVEPYFKIHNNSISIKGGLVLFSRRGIRIERLGQGVYLDPSQVIKIKVGWRKIWPENRFLRFFRDFFGKIIDKYHTVRLDRYNIQND